MSDVYFIAVLLTINILATVWGLYLVVDRLDKLVEREPRRGADA